MNLLLYRIMNKISPFWLAKKNGLQVGKGFSLVSPRTVLFGTEPYLIKVGDNVRISGNVKFITHDGGTWVLRQESNYKDVFKYGTITIGNNVFIGTNVLIMPNVNIGNKCVIGAGSIVTKNIPDGTIAVGVPARVIATIEEYAGKCLESIPKDLDYENYQKNKRKELESKYWRK